MIHHSRGRCHHHVRTAHFEVFRPANHAVLHGPFRPQAQLPHVLAVRLEVDHHETLETEGPHQRGVGAGHGQEAHHSALRIAAREPPRPPGQPGDVPDALQELGTLQVIAQRAPGDACPPQPLGQGGIQRGGYGLLGHQQDVEVGAAFLQTQRVVQHQGGHQRIADALDADHQRAGPAPLRAPHACCGVRFRLATASLLISPSAPISPVRYFLRSNTRLRTLAQIRSRFR